MVILNKLNASNIPTNRWCKLVKDTWKVLCKWTWKHIVNKHYIPWYKSVPRGTCEQPINYLVCSPPSPRDWQQQKRMSHYGLAVSQDRAIWKTTSHSNVCFWYGGSQAAVEPAKAMTPSASLPLFCSSSWCHSSLSWVPPGLLGRADRPALPPGLFVLPTSPETPQLWEPKLRLTIHHTSSAVGWVFYKPTTRKTQAQSTEKISADRRDKKVSSLVRHYLYSFLCFSLLC